MVSETQNANLSACELLASHAVVMEPIGILVLRTIQLEREASLRAIEVQHKSAHCVLSPELETRECSRP